MPKKKSKKTSRGSASKRGSSNTVSELEITLLDIEPRIWRRFVVCDNITLAELHVIVQVVMGWTDSHLHQFVTRDEKRYASPSPYGDPDWDEQVSDSQRVRVRDILPAKGAQLLYEYDFGDGWSHLIKVVGILQSEPDAMYPRCVAGERACPPEDCGGPYNYPAMLAALSDPEHPEHEDLAEWIGSEFDSETFDPDKVNEVLAEFR